MQTRLSHRQSRTRLDTEFLHFEMSAALVEESNPPDPLLYGSQIPMTLSELSAALHGNSATCLFGSWPETCLFLRPSPSQFFRHLALLEMPAEHYCDLPLKLSDVFTKVLQQRTFRKQFVPNSSEARDAVASRLKTYAECAFNVHANQRFLFPDLHQNELLGASIAKLIHEAFCFLDTHGLHPHEFEPLFLCSVCVYHSKLVPRASAGQLSLWSPLLQNKVRYITGSEVFSKPHLAMHGLSQHVTDKKSDTEEELRAFTPAPVTCQLCHVSLLSMDALRHHCVEHHGNFAEYRKRVFFKALQAGHYPMRPWLKRSLVQNFVFFQRFAAPGFCNEWLAGTFSHAEPRCLHACVFCCVRDYPENRHEVFLFQAPTSATTWKKVFYDSDEPGELLHTANNKFCVGPKEKINELLSVEKYFHLQSHIPFSDLLASSVQHPDDESMHWLLHSRRAPKKPCKSRGNSFCAGIGDKNATCYACKSCVQHFCRVSCPELSPLALANLNWLGREQPSFQKLSLGTKLLLGKGRPIMRQIFLGPSAASESYSGLVGNTILLAQAEVATTQILPSINKVLDKLVIVFCKSVDEVKNCKALTVNRMEFLKCLSLRQQHCPAFFQTQIDNKAIEELPAHGVPTQFIEHAIHLPEAAHLQRMAGPADAPLAEAQDAADNCEDENSEMQDSDAEGKSHDTDGLDSKTAADQSPQVMIAVDYEQDPKPAQLFQALQKKLEYLQKEARKVKQNCSKDLWQDVTAVVREVGQQEKCNRLVIDLQDTMKKLLRESKNMDDIAECLLQANAGVHIDALAVPTGEVLSSFDPRTFPSCFTEFYYGDAVPGLADRPNKSLTYQDLFAALMQREEMEYACPDDTEPFQARQISRFDAPEFAAVFGDILRKMKTLQAVNGSFQRQGFERDLKTIASAKTEDFLQAAASECSGSTTAQLVHNHSTPDKVRAALRHILFSTANVPLTEGYKIRLRHFGQSFSHCFGPMTVFSTHNYSDTYNPLMYQLCANLESGHLTEKPAMPTLQRMHELVAAHPACTAKFFLLMEELNFRHLYGVDSMTLGTHKLARAIGQQAIEDDFASSGVPGIAGFVLSILEALEAQGRGFQHGHRIVRAIPGLAEELQLKNEEDLTAGGLRERIRLHNEKLIAKVETLQYEKATLPGEQTGIQMPPEPFTALQQKQCKFDGQLEPDGETRRDYVPLAPLEHMSHIQDTAATSNVYREVSLTGAELSMLPGYRLPSSIPASAKDIFLDAPTSCFRLISKTAGVVDDILTLEGQPCTINHLLHEAKDWEKHFSKDFRFLHVITHNHEYSVTCLKHVKKRCKRKDKC